MDHASVAVTEYESAGSSRTETLELSLRSWLLSLCVHASLMIVLACWFQQTPAGIGELVLELGKSFESGQPSVPLVATDMAPVLVSQDDPRNTENPLDELVLPTDVPMEVFPIASDPAQTPMAVIPVNLQGDDTGLGQHDSTNTPGEIGGRSGRRSDAIGRGATAESEAAVDRALAWLATHQLSNGSWCFDLHECQCNGRCGQSGHGSAARNAATGLAILPFLGAGHTHEAGKYRSTVQRGLSYLVKSQQKDGGFWEPQGNMYSHGVCALTLCEAWAMSKGPGNPSPTNRRVSGLDPSVLRRATQRAINYIVEIQHAGGGWRYQKGEPGDTSVVAWQSMALRSGVMAGLAVPPRTLQGIDRFLDSVQADNYGALYGYLPGSGGRESMTAAGLLCRQYAGWSRGHPAIVNGAEKLAEWGPSSNNVYYNYYATQVLHHFQGARWDQWNRVLRDYLVAEQSQEGHELGSWYFEDDFGSDIGGRLYITAMSTMTLEVYYRHMPIYTTNAVGEDP
ncbi:MAG: terpene cyclase/mutase family protein [Planctomycetota bacterium]|nr:terpene cyclase/mutase family protein [Planctomycetota bacterium]MDA1177210.1 terpene cyclase/mutase family protein [Planctomycetota bacterium]